MYDLIQCKEIFEHYGGIMRTGQLNEEKIFYRKLQRLIADGYVEKVRAGCYQWVDSEEFSETGTITRLYPDAILCMDSALHYYGYSERTPAKWHLAVSKDGLSICKTILCGAIYFGTWSDRGKYGWLFHSCL